MARTRNKGKSQAGTATKKNKGKPVFSPVIWDPPVDRASAFARASPCLSPRQLPGGIEQDSDESFVQLDGPSSVLSAKDDESPSFSRRPSDENSDSGASAGSTTTQSDAPMTFQAAIQMGPPGRDPESTLRLCDTIRASLATHKSISPTDLTRLTKFLDGVLLDEMHAAPTMLDYDAIMHARLDKLIDDLLDPLKRPAPMPGRHYAAIIAAASLQRRWKARFGELYEHLDEARYEAIQTTGSLRGVAVMSFDRHGKAVWETDEPEPTSEMQADPKFDVGEWWPNMACAHRDGMVGNAFERPTKGRYGAATLPLLTGEEEVFDGHHGDGTLSRFVRQAPVEEGFHASLLSQVGKEVHILRGHQLRSVYAPAGGVRYDGRYKIKSWCLHLSTETALYTTTITLQRSPGQPSPLGRILRRVPRPSQLDDWRLAERIEADRAAASVAERATGSWRRRKEAERAEREAWRAARKKRERGEEGNREEEEKKTKKKSKTRKNNKTEEEREGRRASVKIALPGTGGDGKGGGGGSGGAGGGGGGLAPRIRDPREEPTPMGTDVETSDGVVERDVAPGFEVSAEMMVQVSVE